MTATVTPPHILDKFDDLAPMSGDNLTRLTYGLLDIRKPPGQLWERAHDWRPLLRQSECEHKALRHHPRRGAYQMTLDHAPSIYRAPVQWADDWLTPTERRALRAIESAPASYTPMRAQKSLSQAYSARQKRIRARRVQLIAQTVTYLTIATLFVLSVGCAIRIAVALYGN